MSHRKIPFTSWFNMNIKTPSQDSYLRLALLCALTLEIQALIIKKGTSTYISISIGLSSYIYYLSIALYLLITMYIYISYSCLSVDEGPSQQLLIHGI